MGTMRFAMIGSGFWAQYQLSGWRELPGVECVAVCNRTAHKAAALAQKFAISSVYTDARDLFRKEKLDFVDVVTDVATHCSFVKMAAEHHLPVICQKPMAPALHIAEQMVQSCRDAGVPLFVNENWRWQTPIRELKRILSSGIIGSAFRARLDMISGFPVLRNQPFLKELDQFILTDLGSHILDVARFLFGEAESVYCQTHRVHPDIKGEDVATVLLKMAGPITVVVEMAYAENPLERECFPQTLIFVEGDAGSAEITRDYWLHVTTKDGTRTSHHPPHRYPWVDPAYEIVHASIVPCQANLLEGLRGGSAETTGEDNLKTLKLVFAAYESSARNQVITP
jgi:D-apiose dehydrogenase